MRSVRWQNYAGQGGWWKKGRAPTSDLLTGSQAAWWAERHADAKKPRRKKRGRR